MNGDSIRAALAQVKDPLFDRDVVALGYVKKAEADGAKATIELQLPTPAHPHRAQIEEAVKAAAKSAGASEVALT
ncbi:MAG TPA: iron-sulfur cluster assembly protein, partial [Polyangia bacterium]|nr:iron-sulfur cluster assembly protein [Polyangia bacterium]